MSEFNQDILVPSGLHQQFRANTPVNFLDYIKQCQQLIAQARLDLTPATAQEIINANAPFILQPRVPNGKGALLIHGLFSSPYVMRDIAHFLADQGYLVYGLLLPGHGTRPADLQHVDYHDWLRAVRFGVAQLSKLTHEIVIVGHSIGAALGIQQAISDQRIKALVLFAPAIGSVQKAAALASLLHCARILGDWTQWYWRCPPSNPYRYESYCINAAVNACHVMQQTKRLLQQQQLAIPTFNVLSWQDETVDSPLALSLLLNQVEPRCQAIVYSNTAVPVADSRVTLINSRREAEGIVDYSHQSLMIAPEHPFFGRQGSYIDYTHYHNKPPRGEHRLGAASAYNIKHYQLQRLNYNPDFDRLLQSLAVFLSTIS